MKNFILLLGVILAIYGCETTDGDGGTGGEAGAGGTGGSAGGGGAGGEGGAGGGVANCPDPTGVFGNPTTIAGDCGALDAGTSQRITAGAAVCNFAFTASGTPGLTGPFTLDTAGTFSNANLTVNGGSLPPCSGTWTDPTMSVTCGTCMVTLTRQ